MIFAFVSRQAHKGSNHDGPIREFKSHQVGLQISRRFHSKIPPEDAVWGLEATSRSGIQATGRTEGKPRRRRAFDARPRSHVAVDTAEICGQSGGRVHQRQERNPPRASLWRAKARVCRSTAIREYIKNRESEVQKLEQLNLWR